MKILKIKCISTTISTVMLIVALRNSSAATVRFQSGTGAKKDTTAQPNTKNGKVNKKQLTDLDELLLSYKKIQKFDTTLIFNRKDTIKISFQHYCSFDNKIVVPKGPHNPKVITHNFVSLIKVQHNSTTTFKGIIKKEDFENQHLDDFLIKNGVLYYYGISNKVYANTITLTYRVSLPLSDGLNGDLLLINIDSKGKVMYSHTGE